MSLTRSARAAGWRLPVAAVMCVALAACGVSAQGAGDTSKHTTTTSTAAAEANVGGPTAAAANADPGSGTRREVADPQEAESYPAPATVRHPRATAPVKAGANAVAAGALSDAEVRRDLQETETAQKRAASERQRNTLKPVPGGQSIGGDGTIPIPTNVPETVQKVVAGANEIADFPYVFGGGHGSFVDHAYDCSGSVSYALAAAGLLSAPETSGELESWGKPGPGRYITVFANAGHTYMYVDGILYDTAGRSGVYASRWLVGSTDNSGFVARHWPGL
jgi:cell wall-associated NlpC family hydrolase